MIDTKAIIAELRAYAKDREWFEFKENWSSAVDLGSYISALSNSAALAGRDNAYFVWGINDQTHDIVGTVFDPDQDVKGEPLEHFLARQLHPDLNFTFDEVQLPEGRVVLLTIPAAKTVPTEFAKERYIRIGSSKENLRKYPEKESFLLEVLRHGASTLENTPSDYQDLTFENLLIYYGAKGLKLKQDTFKKNLALLTDDGRYNLLAQLLADNSHIPIRVAIFSGASKADNLYSVREFGNQCLLYSLDEVLRYGDVLNIIQADERNRVVERKEVPLFANDAFREAVVNAFIHNKWVTGNEPMFTVFSDRIEILSRGALAPEQTMEGFFAGESVPVNKKLSEIMLQLHISEKTGRGVPVITRRYGKKAYDFRENSIVVTIPFNWINVMGDRVGKPGDKYAGDDVCDRAAGKAKSQLAAQALSATQALVLNAIRSNPHATRERLAQVVGVGTTTIDKSLAVLKQLGFIERIGSNKTGYWRVLR